MNVIVTDSGFVREDTDPGAEVLDLGPGDDVADLEDRLDALPLIRIAFPSFSDGRGFSLARRLRLMGYRGRLRATGDLIADQYAMARRSGFDEVEITPERAERQPEDQWLFRADWRARDYRAGL